MATRVFATYKFLYDRDDGLQQVKSQRDYRDLPSGNLLTPITPLFLARVTGLDTKIPEPNVRNARHVMSYVTNPNVQKGYSELKAYSPYQPGDVRLAQHLREIEAVPRVICSDYHGEEASKI
ncbi:MAG: hypothetical protein HC916_07850 [Coleofasciculaceae cyanobacterium SM2_1_6]|nr:hypothetical protein [Coleofasciculaceae cyanobacterium SM2_1_6]